MRSYMRAVYWNIDFPKKMEMSQFQPLKCYGLTLWAISVGVRGMTSVRIGVGAR